MSNNAGKTISFILTDFDRTIVDLGVNWIEVRKRVAKMCSQNGAIIEQEGRSLFDIIKEFREFIFKIQGNAQFADAKAEEMFSIIKEGEMLALKTATLMPGAKEFLQWAKDKSFNFAVVSNNHQDVIKKAIEKFGLERPVMIIGSDNVSKRKPDSEGVDKILQKQGVERRQCILIGDSRIDTELGKNAGIKTCIIGTWEGNAKNFKEVKQRIIS